MSRARTAIVGVASTLVLAMGCGTPGATAMMVPTSSVVAPTMRLPPLDLLSGTVVIQLALEGAKVSAVCASGSVLDAITDRDGGFTLDLADALLPCTLEASGGTEQGAVNTLRLHGYAEQHGAVVLDAFSELVLAFAGAAPSRDDLTEARAYLSAQLTSVGLDPDTVDVLSGPFQLGDATSHLVDRLWDKLAVSHHSLVDLAARSSARQPWGTLLDPAASTWAWDIPSTLVTPIVPDNNPMSDTKVTLGRFLFYDKRLSGNGTYSCASCHRQEKAFTDGLALAIGSTSEPNTRSAQQLGNVAFNPTLTWANPMPRTLEEQMLVPLFGTHPIEIGVTDSNQAEILQRLQADPGYLAQFAAAYPGQDNIVSWRNVVRAISAFERTMLTGNSRYDRAMKGTGPALAASEAHGATLFFNAAKCFRCHGNFNFTDTATYAGGPAPELRFHNTGLFNLGGNGAFPAPNRGIYEFTSLPTDMGKFRAPSLRNIAVTAPYMHDGSLATLQDVVDFYVAGGRNVTSGPNAGDGRLNPYKSDIVNGIVLSAQDNLDLVAFLKTLTDDDVLADPKLSDPFPSPM